MPPAAKATAQPLLPPPPMPVLKPRAVTTANPTPLAKPPSAALKAAPDYSWLMEQQNGPVPPVSKFMMDWNSPENMKAVSDFRQSLNTAKAMAGHEGAEALTHFYQANPWAGMLGMPLEAMANTMYNVAVKNGMDDPQTAAWNTPQTLTKLAMLTYNTMHAAATGDDAYSPGVLSSLRAFQDNFSDHALGRTQEIVMKNMLGWVKQTGDLIPQMSAWSHADWEKYMAGLEERKVQVEEHKAPLVEAGMKAGINLTNEQAIAAKASANEMFVRAQWWPSQVETQNAAALAKAGLDKAMTVSQFADIGMKAHGGRLAETQMYLGAFKGTIDVLQSQLGSAREEAYKLQQDGLDKPSAGADQPNSRWKNVQAKIADLEQQKGTAIDHYNEVSKASVGQANSHGEWVAAYPSSPSCGVETAQMLNVAAAQHEYNLDQIWKGAAATSGGFRRTLFPVEPIVEDQPGSGSFRFVHVDSKCLLNEQQVDKVYGWATQPAILHWLHAGGFPNEEQFRKILGTPPSGQDASLVYSHFVNILDYVRALDYQAAKGHAYEQHKQFTERPPMPHQDHPLLAPEQPHAAPAKKEAQ